jgi:hypothetical protein
LLGDYAFVVLDQIEQQVEHLRLQWSCCTSHAKLAARGVQLELVENDCHAADFQEPR